LLLHEQDLAVAAAASRLLLLAQSQADLLAWVCQTTLVTRLLDAPSPEARLRIFHLYATLAGHNESCFKAVLGTGVLQAALDCYTQSDDILVQLNVVESLKLLTACDAACTWLSTPTVLDALLLPLTPKGAANPFQNMLLPVTFDFLATLAASQELDFTDWDARYGLLNAFAVAMDSSDSTILHAALGAWTQCLRQTALCQLLLQDGKAQTLRDRYAHHLLHARYELKVKLYSQLADTILRAEPEALGPVLEAAQGRKVCASVFEAATSSFPEQSAVALALLGSLFTLAWARQELLNVPGMLEYLLDQRHPELHAGRLAKYNAVQLLVEHGAGELSAEDRLALRGVLRDGPFSVPVEARVAIADEAA